MPAFFLDSKLLNNSSHTRGTSPGNNSCLVNWILVLECCKTLKMNAFDTFICSMSHYGVRFPRSCLPVCEYCWVISLPSILQHTCSEVIKHSNLKFNFYCTLFLESLPHTISNTKFLYGVCYMDLPDHSTDLSDLFHANITANSGCLTTVLTPL